MKFRFRAIVVSLLTAFFAMDQHGIGAVEIPQYGLYETAFTVNLAYSDPYDADEVRVDAHIQTPNGATIVPCFYDGEEGWKLRFTPSVEGEYSFRIEATSSDERETVAEGEFTVTPRSHRGFVRIGDSPRHFAFEDGEGYFPLGQNLGWVHRGDQNLWMDYLRECEEAGINWIRIWMCSWGNTELVWMPEGGRYHGLERYELRNARLWDAIYAEAERRGIYIQHVINHHGQYSKRTNPIWDSNPYNVANGGFLEEPWHFFTDEEAKRHYRNRLRYLVARWGYSTHLMAWEFWNEADLTSNWDFEVGKVWHDEMSTYLRGIDPYNHLQTTSSSADTPRLAEIEGIDFLQSHAYTTDIIGRQQIVSGRYAREVPDRPHFFGEMSYDWRGPNREDREGVILHNQLWSSVHSWDSGTAMTWWWDNWVRPYNLYYHFRHVADYLDGIDWNADPMLPMLSVTDIHPDNLSELIFAPVVTWGPTETAEFEILPSGEVTDIERASTFIHGNNHRQMSPNPTFIFNAAKPTRFGVQINRAASSGAMLIIRLNGETVLRQVFAEAAEETTMGEEEGGFAIEVPAGKNRIEIRNPGRDWFEVKHYWVEDVAQRPHVYARGNQNQALIWVHDRPHQFSLIQRYEQYDPVQPVEVTLPTLRSGEYRIERFDPYTGERELYAEALAGDEGLRFTLPSFLRDIAFRIEKAPSRVGSAQAHD